MNAPLSAQLRNDLPAGTSAHPLRIALLGYRSHPHVGGQGVYLRYLSRALVELGHQVHVLSGPPYPQLDPRVQLVKIPSLDLYTVLPHHLRALRWHHLRRWSDFYEWWTMATGGFAEPYTFGRRVVRYLKDKRDHYDIIHDNQSLCSGLLTLQQSGWPVIATVHHPITRDRQLALAEANTWQQRLLTKRWYSFVAMQTRVIRRLRHVVTVSQAARADIASEFGLPSEQIRVFGNGVDTALFRPQPHIPRQPALIITTTSSDQPLKGFAVLLHALQQVLQSQPAARLRVIGRLKADGANARLLRSLGLQQQVEFASDLSEAELVDEYARATVAVCPSLYEGFGLPAAEAMACAVAVVSSDGGALAEVVADAGLVVPAGDSHALAAALLRVMQQPDLARDLGERGRLRVEQHFCWRRVAALFSEYYQQVLCSQRNSVVAYANH